MDVTVFHYFIRKTKVYEICFAELRMYHFLNEEYNKSNTKLFFLKYIIIYCHDKLFGPDRKL